jgi:SAM-dependent methyltransferase
MKRPYRSPTEIPILVKEYLYGKTFCEIGCGEGDLLEQFAKYADNAIGIEISPACESVLRALERKVDNIEIIIGDVFRVGIPHADVYYFWITQRIDERLIKRVPNSTIIIHKVLSNKLWLETVFAGRGKTRYIEFKSNEDPHWPNNPKQPYPDITIDTPLVIGILQKS